MERALPAGAEVIDVADLLRSIQHRWKLVLGATILGLLLATAIILWATVRFSGAATVVLKSSAGSGPSSSLAQALGAIAEAGGGAALSGMKPSVETEVEVIQSRVLAGNVVDSLGLQVQTLHPRAFPAAKVVADASLPGLFREVSYDFIEEKGSSPRRYRFQSNRDADAGVATVGQPARLAIGAVTLDSHAPAGKFTLKFRDREDAITRLIEHLDLGKPKSEVVTIRYSADDSLLAASVPNLLLDLYLQRRRTVDRSVNQYRADFLTTKVDSLARALAASEDALRAQREGSGVIDPMTIGRVGLENETRLRSQITDLRVQEGALRQLVDEITSGKATPRSLASYPSYVGNGAIANIVSSLIGVETERQASLQVVTEADIGARTLAEKARALEAQLIPLAQSTLTSIASERAGLQSRLDSTQRALVGIPRQAEAFGRLERQILDQGKIYALVQAQLVDAKLAAMTEGGEVRQLDAASVPKYRAFPRKKVTFAAGLGGGMIFGLLLAAFLGVAGGAMHDTIDIERRTGLPAVRFEETAPLLVSGQAARTVLVAPINRRAVAGPVANRLVETAIARSLTATVLDLTKSDLRPAMLAGNGNGSHPSLAVSFDANAAIARLEESNDLVVVHLPELTSHAAAAVLRPDRPVLLVAPERRIDQGSMRGAVDLLRRVGTPCAGVVLNGDDRKTLRG